MSLSEALDRLAHESDQLAYHAGANIHPAGPFTSAYLYLEPGANILSLIRDAGEGEKRPFRILSSAPEPQLPSSGYPHHAAHADRRPAVQLRTGEVLTPLKTVRARRGTPGELDATLDAAQRMLAAVADSYHMAKYTAHVKALARQHAEQAEALARLQAEIDAFASRPARKSPSPEPEEPRVELSVDDAIKAEEEALRALERSIAPLKRNQPASPRSPRSPRSPQSPMAAKSPERRFPATPSRTLHFPGTTPRRPSVPAAATPRAPTPRGRFEPLHLFGTPRATPRPALAGSTSAREELPPAGRSIFGNYRKPAPALGESAGGRESTGAARPDAIAAGVCASQAAPGEPLSTSTRSVLAEPAPPTPLPQAQAPPTPAPAPPTPAPAEEPGIDPADPEVARGTRTVWAKMADVMRMLAPPGAETPEATISHLTAVSRADASGGVTQEGVMMAVAALALLRGPVPMGELKAGLAAAAAERGWGADLAQRTVYAGVGRRAWKIDRRAGGGGRVHLA